ARAAPPATATVPPVPAASAKEKAAALAATPPPSEEPQWVAAAPLQDLAGATGIEKLPRLRPPVLVREDVGDGAKLPTPPPPRADRPPALIPGDGLPGRITSGGRPVTFGTLTAMVDGSGGAMGGGGCSACGDCGPGRPCAAGARKCEPFPYSKSHVIRFVGL